MAPSDHEDSVKTASSVAVPGVALGEPRGWIEALGLELIQVTAELVLAEWTVGPKHLQPHGIVHGGVYTSVVETCCSLGAALAAPAGKVVVGVENHTSFVRQARQGRLRARATPIHAGRRAQLWECNILDAGGRLIATGRLRVMSVEAELER
jgi:1,4-dihydroxy-2-naphthoyl-CoA hydrolase